MTTGPDSFTRKRRPFSLYPGAETRAQGREKFVPPSDDGPTLDDRGHDEQAVLESRQLYIQIRLCRSQRAASLCGIGGDALRRERGVGFRRIAIQQSRRVFIILQEIFPRTGSAGEGCLRLYTTTAAL